MAVRREKGKKGREEHEGEEEVMKRRTEIR
jgi:hypothetical protein